MTQLLAVLADIKPGFAEIWPNAVFEDRLAAVFTTAKLRPRIGRKAVARAAVDRQAALEALMPFGTVLPALPGTALPLGTASAMLRANRSEINFLASRLRGRVQFQLQVSYDPAQAQTWLGPAPGDIDMRMRQTVERRANQSLDKLDCEDLELPVAAGLALNRVLLIDQSDEPALDHAVEDLDALWSDGLVIRQIGPSPAVSFASIGLAPVRSRDLDAAFAQLGLLRDASPDTISAARRRALASHPAMADSIRMAAQIATISAQTGLASFHRLIHWSEGQRAPEHTERDVA